MTSGLSIRSVSKTFGGIAVAKDLTVDLRPGDRAALIGPNGAGKTTFSNLITGAITPTSGEIFLDGALISGLSAAQRVRAGIAKTFQITNLLWNLTVRENVRLPILQREARTKSIWRRADASADTEAEIEALLNQFGLLRLADRRVRELAYGQQRLLELAVTLALRPRYVILDEPAAGVPTAESRLIVDAVRALPKDIGILIIEHDMKLVFELATRIIVLVAGAILMEGSPTEISRDDRVRKLYLGGRHG